MTVTTESVERFVRDAAGELLYYDYGDQACPADSLDTFLLTCRILARFKPHRLHVVAHGPSGGTTWTFRWDDVDLDWKPA